MIATYHDIIRFSPKTPDSIFHTCKPLYEKGCSIREIERQTGIPKTTVREALQGRGFTLRSFKKDKGTSKTRPAVMRSGVIPYGYAYLEGQLVKNPAEYAVVNKIIKFWQSGKSLIAIAKLLNDQNVPTRLGKKWVHSVVGAIVKRHQKLFGEK